MREAGRVTLAQFVSQGKERTAPTRSTDPTLRAIATAITRTRLARARGLPPCSTSSVCRFAATSAGAAKIGGVRVQLIAEADGSDRYSACTSGEAKRSTGMRE